MSERIKKWRSAAKQYITERKEIAKWSAKQVETGIRTGESVILEFGIPPGLSAEFEEGRRRRLKEARYKFFKEFDPFRRFTERKIVK